MFCYLCRYITRFIFYIRKIPPKDAEFTFGVHNCLLIGNCFINASLAAGVGYCITYWLQDDVFLAWKVGSVMVVVGYRIRILPPSSDKKPCHSRVEDTHEK